MRMYLEIVSEFISIKKNIKRIKKGFSKGYIGVGNPPPLITEENVLCISITKNKYSFRTTTKQKPLCRLTKFKISISLSPIKNIDVIFF